MAFARRNDWKNNGTIFLLRKDIRFHLPFQKRYRARQRTLPLIYLQDIFAIITIYSARRVPLMLIGVNICYYND